MERIVRKVINLRNVFADHLSHYYVPKNIRPNIVDRYVGHADIKSDRTFVMVCPPSFHQENPSAVSNIQLGFVRGFQQLGIKSVLVSVFDLERELPLLKNPFVYIGSYAYKYLKRTAIVRLKSVPHFVWVLPWAKELQEVHLKHPEADWGLKDKIYHHIVKSEPNFVWAPVGKKGASLYASWERHGCRFNQIHLACDTEKYYPEEGNEKYRSVCMAFVGTYQKIKAASFETFLRPYEDRLLIYGTNSWPFSGYKGTIPESEERRLYQNARLSPTINAEACYDFWDEVNERVFKVMGSGGLSIVDPVSAYSELFKSDELLMPANYKEYQEMVDWVLSDEAANAKYRDLGLKAILSRHTYAHRSQQILDLLY